MIAPFENPIPVLDFRFPEPGPTMFELQCPKHPHSRYLTKNPYQRSLHYCPKPEDMFEPECKCPFESLEVVSED